MAPYSMLLQSPLYGFAFTDAHRLYHSDILHQSDKGNIGDSDEYWCLLPQFT